MAFLFSLMLSCIYSSTASRLKLSFGARLIFYLLICISLLALPALQFSVGTDYDTYTEIFNNPDRLDLYQRKGEYLFYYLVIFLNFLKLDSQSLFISIGLIQTVLLINALLLISNTDLRKVAVLIFLVFIVTNMMNNQLNVLRSFVAIFSFINAYIYLQLGKRLVAFLFLLFGFYWHNSILLTLPFFFLNNKAHDKVVKHALGIYFLSMLIYASGVINMILNQLVGIFLPSFVRYMESRSGSVALVNLLTKVYYIPVHLIFFGKLYGKFNSFTNLEKALLSIWLLTCNLYLYSLYFSGVSRVVDYFAFFNIIPLYFIYTYGYKRLFYLLSAYCFFAYFMKVTVFARNEFSYQSILFM